MVYTYFLNDHDLRGSSLLHRRGEDTRRRVLVRRMIEPALHPESAFSWKRATESTQKEGVGGWEGKKDYAFPCFAGETNAPKKTLGGVHRIDYRRQTVPIFALSTPATKRLRIRTHITYILGSYNLLATRVLDGCSVDYTGKDRTLPKEWVHAG